MDKVFGYIVAGILGLVLAWIGVGVVTEHGVKEPAFVVERSADGYEVRRYEPYLVAEVQVPPGTEDPLGTGFRMLFKYIGGANQGSRKIEMTAPVLKEEPEAEKISMTKPVLRRQEQGVTRVRIDVASPRKGGSHGNENRVRAGKLFRTKAGCSIRPLG